MKELVSFIAKQLVDHPDEVVVDSQENDGVIQLVLKVAESDKGKIIGKQGKVIKAIRALVGVTSQKTDKKDHLEIA